MALDLESLKTEILAQLKRKGFAIFFSDGEAEGLDVIYWDTRRYPDFRQYLDAAQQCGVKMVVFYERVFSQASIDDMLERVADSDLPREEKRSYELRLQELQKYEGFTGQLAVYFEVGTHFYMKCDHCGSRISKTSSPTLRWAKPRRVSATAKTKTRCPAISLETDERNWLAAARPPGRPLDISGV